MQFSCNTGGFIIGTLIAKDRGLAELAKKQKT